MENFVDIIKQNIEKTQNTNPYKKMMALGLESINLFEKEKRDSDSVKNIVKL